MLSDVQVIASEQAKSEQQKVIKKWLKYILKWASVKW